MKYSFPFFYCVKFFSLLSKCVKEESSVLFKGQKDTVTQLHSRTHIKNLNSHKKKRKNRRHEEHERKN